MPTTEELLEELSDTTYQRDSAEREAVAWITFQNPEKARAAQVVVDSCNRKLADLMAELTAILPD